MKVAGLLSLLMLPGLLAGCASERKVYLPSGAVAHVIECGGPALNFGHCVEKAGDICRGMGYTVLNQQGGQVPSDPASMPTGGLLDASLEMQPRKLLIRCNY